MRPFSEENTSVKYSSLGAAFLPYTILTRCNLATYKLKEFERRDLYKFERQIVSQGNERRQIWLPAGTCVFLAAVNVSPVVYCLPRS